MHRFLSCINNWYSNDDDKVCNYVYLDVCVAQERDVEIKKAVSQEEIRRQEAPKGRSGGNPGYFGRDSGSYAGSRDAYSYGRGGMTYGAMGKE